MSSRNYSTRSLCRSQKSAFSLNGIKSVTQACEDCSEVKATFFNPKDDTNLIKATQPFERISLDFKGSLSSVSKNTYLLVIVDEFTRFPFAYACSDMKASTVTQKLTDLFCLFGFANYVHSDQKPSLANCVISLTYQKITVDLLGICIATCTTLYSISVVYCYQLYPHERMFFHTRKSFNSVSLPFWIKPGPVFVQRHNRNKNDILVEEAELIEANHRYAHVMLHYGREITVLLQDLVPNPESLRGQNHDADASEKDADDILSLDHNKTSAQAEQDTGDVAVHSRFESHDFDLCSLNENQNDLPVLETTSRENPPVLRRSSRMRKPIDRYGNNIYY